MTPFLFSIEFESYLSAEKRYSQHTVAAYLLDVGQFWEFAPIQRNEEISEITSKVIRGWMVSLINGGYTNKSVNRKLSSLRTYFTFLKRNGVITKNPLTGLNGPKSEKRLPHFANEEDLNREPVENNPGTMSFSELRDCVMRELLYQTGIRLNELIQLRHQDVQQDKIKVLGKRNKERIIPVSNELGMLLNNYRNELRKMGFSESYLIVTDKGNKVYPKFVYRKINNYLGRATDLEKCSPHVLRHTFATHMLNNGAGIETIKELLGHASLSATQIYTHNSFAQLTNIYSLAHPRGRKN